MSAFRAILVICAIPALGFIVYWTIIWDLLDHPDFLAPLYLTYLCEFAQVQDSGLASACDSVRPINLIGVASIASFSLGLIIPAVFWIVARLVGSNRVIMAKVFPPLTFVGIILVAALFFVHAGILAAGIYYGEAYWFERVHFIVVGIMALVGFGGAFVMVVIAFNMFRPATVSVIGNIADAENFPKLHEFILSIADQISARHPDNIVLGLDDQFFATSARVNIIGDDRPLSGETLYPRLAKI